MCWLHYRGWATESLPPVPPLWAAVPGSQASWRVGGARLFVRRVAPICFVLFLFFFRPLRLGETLHLVREEILLRPLYDPKPSVFYCCCDVAAAVLGGGGVLQPPHPSCTPTRTTMLPLLF